MLTGWVSTTILLCRRKDNVAFILQQHGMACPVAVSSEEAATFVQHLIVKKPLDWLYHANYELIEKL